MIDRRQFGIWTVSALLVGPQVAAAHPPGEHQAMAPPKAPPPTGISELTVTVKRIASEPLSGEPMSPDTEAQVDFQISVHNPGSKGLTVMIDDGLTEVEVGKERRQVTTWMNDSHPYSRRVVFPAFIDLAPKSTVLAGVLHVGLPAAVLASKDSVLHIQIQLNDDKGTNRTVTLDPIPLHESAAGS